MSWPYTPADCPRCHYFDPIDPPFRTDDGYDLVGTCGHPQIAMELFRMRFRPEPERCSFCLPRDRIHTVVTPDEERLR